MYKCKRMNDYTPNLLESNHPGVKVIIAPTIGIDLSKYNKMPWNIEDQTALNDIIIQVNKTIVKLNNQNTKLPWISALVHRCQGNGRWVHRYHHLKDGCHFSRKMKDFCTEKIIKCLIRN